MVNLDCKIKERQMDWMVLLMDNILFYSDGSVLFMSTYLNPIY